jgi:hypothetical protein
VCRLATTSDQLFEFDQRRKFDAGRPYRHAGTSHRIDHPSGHRDHDTGRAKYPQKRTCRPLLDATNTNLLAEIRMPSIMDFHFIADMGRMNW